MGRISKRRGRGEQGEERRKRSAADEGGRGEEDKEIQDGWIRPATVMLGSLGPGRHHLRATLGIQVPRRAAPHKTAHAQRGAACLAGAKRKVRRSCRGVRDAPPVLALEQTNTKRTEERK